MQAWLKIEFISSCRQGKKKYIVSTQDYGNNRISNTMYKYNSAFPIYFYTGYGFAKSQYKSRNNSYICRQYCHIVSKISDDQDIANWFSQVENVINWCNENLLMINVDKTRETIIRNKHFKNEKIEPL